MGLGLLRESGPGEGQADIGPDIGGSETKPNHRGVAGGPAGATATITGLLWHHCPGTWVSPPTGTHMCKKAFEILENQIT